MAKNLKTSASKLGASVLGALNMGAPKDDVGLQTVDGLLTWSQPVDAFHLKFRHVRRGTNAIVHIILILCSIATLILFGWRVVQQQEIGAVLTRTFWFAGYAEVAWFWVGVFLDCFIIFRLFEYSNQAKTILGWGKGAAWAKARESTAKDRLNIQYEVSPYFADDAWETIEGAYQLASKLKKEDGMVMVPYESVLAVGDFVIVEKRNMAY